MDCLISALGENENLEHNKWLDLMNNEGEMGSDTLMVMDARQLMFPIIYEIRDDAKV
jgi:hypothetical protein